MMDLLVHIFQAWGMLQCVLALFVFAVARGLGYWDRVTG